MKCFRGELAGGRLGAVACVVPALCASFFLAPLVGARADELVFLEKGAAWKFLPGSQEASSPDTGAWRQPDFDDAAWPTGALPIGFGADGIATDLSLLDPPMQRNYTSVFLRTTFEVPDPDALRSFVFDVEYDDGAVIWINGNEAARLNVAGNPGDPITIEDAADRSHRNDPELHGIDGFSELIVPGRNVLAVQVFNSSVSSNDVYFDVRVVDPLGPDLTPPEIEFVIPAPWSTVRSLTQVEVNFHEPVAGVDAADLLVGGAPADAVGGSGAGPYIFRFAPPAVGEVTIAWAQDAGIRDTSPAANVFVPDGGWRYTLDPGAPPPDLVINELLTNNVDGILDEDSDPSDWIEIHNRGTEPVNLLRWGLSDERGRGDKWLFPNVQIDPGEYLVVFASGKDRRPASGNLHTSFKLNNTGEPLALYSAESPRVLVSGFATEYPEQRGGISYGLADGESGEGYHYLQSPTPGQPNDAASIVRGFSAPPEFSVEHGFFDEAFTLELSTATAGATIHYTLDGSEPTESSEVYETGIEIAGSAARAVVTVRAATFAAALLPSESRTQTYIFPAHVSRQPAAPEGFPTRWGGGAPAVDYEMDPEVVDDPAYSDLMVEALTALPSLSIVADVDDIFGPRGIYSNPSGSGVGWEKACSAELIHPDGREGFEINCGIRIYGGASRETNKSPKHFFRLLFKGAYGSTKLSYPLYPESAVKTFDTLILRNGFNNSWCHWNGGQRARALFIRDQLMRDVQRDMGHVASHGVYAHVYLNGLYWGVTMIAERPSGPFSASYFGGEKEEYDSVNSAIPTDGQRTTTWSSFVSEVQRGDYSTPEALDELDANLLDVRAYIDYMILNHYGGNHDWADHNWYASRRLGPGGKWRVYSWDAERVLEGVGDNRTGVSNGPATFFRALSQSPEFRVLFGDRVHRHLFNDGVLTPEGAAELFETRARQLEVAIIAESARWGDYRRDVHRWQDGPFQFYTRDEFWTRERQRLLSTYFPGRTAQVVGQYRNLRLYPRVGAPIFSRHGGAVDPGFELGMSLPDGTEGTIYYTTDGSDPRVRGTGDVSPAAFTYERPVAVPGVVQVKSRTLDPGGEWSALNEATFHPPTSPLESLRITEIMYHPPEGGDYEFIEIANTGEAPVFLGGLQFTSGISYTFPGGTLAAGARLVLASRAETLEEVYPGLEVAGRYLGGLDNAGEEITLADERGETIVSVDYDDESLWPVGPDGFGYSLVLVDPDGDPDDPRSWRASAEVGGSPGGEDPPAAHGGVVVNEILPRTTAPREPAVELANLTDADIDVGGWYLSDNRADLASLQKFQIPAGTTIPGGGYVVFYQSDFAADPASPNSIAPSGDGGAVYLAAADAAGGPTGYIVAGEYGPLQPGMSAGRHETSVGVDFTPLRQPTFGRDNAASVEEFRQGRGAPNAKPHVGPVVINELMYHPEDGESEFVELHNVTGNDVALYDEATGRGWQIRGVPGPDVDRFEFADDATVPAGGYLLVVPEDPEAFRSRYSVPASVPIVGPYGGALSNAGERIRLMRPALGQGADTVFSPVDQVRYNDRAPWPGAADGDGPSLERILASEYAGEPMNWDSSRRSGGTPGMRNSVSPEGDGGFQIPSDLNQDGELNISDAVSMLGYLFGGIATSLPCEGAAGAGGNLTLLDASGDGSVNLTDAIHLLTHLFQAGPAPALGTDCVRIAGCPDACAN